MNKSQTVIETMQLLLFIAALILLAVNKHETFQDFMIFSILCGGVADNKKLKNDIKNREE